MSGDPWRQVTNVGRPWRLVTNVGRPMAPGDQCQATHGASRGAAPPAPCYDQNRARAGAGRSALCRVQPVQTVVSAPLGPAPLSVRGGAQTTPHLPARSAVGGDERASPAVERRRGLLVVTGDW